MEAARACEAEGMSAAWAAREPAVITAGKFIFVLRVSGLMHRIAVRCLSGLGLLQALIVRQGGEINPIWKGFLLRKLLRGPSHRTAWRQKGLGRVVDVRDSSSWEFLSRPLSQV